MLGHEGLVAAAGLVEFAKTLAGTGQPEDAPLRGERRRSPRVDRHVAVRSFLEAATTPRGIDHEEPIAIGQGGVGQHNLGPGRSRCAIVAGHDILKSAWIALGHGCEAFVPAGNLLGRSLRADQGPVCQCRKKREHHQEDRADVWPNTINESHGAGGKIVFFIVAQAGHLVWFHPCRLSLVVLFGFVLTAAVLGDHLPWVLATGALRRACGNAMSPPNRKALPQGVKPKPCCTMAVPFVATGSPTRRQGQRTTCGNGEGLVDSVIHCDPMSRLPPMSPPPEEPAAAPRTPPPRRVGVPGLNPAQAEAVLAPPGQLLVLAGAGTGKTRVVITRMAQLVKRGTPPSRILAVTFTNKAAREMLARTTAMLGGKGRGKRPAGDKPERPEISTIHSLCVRILRRHAATLGYPERFAIIDRGEQESAARAALKAIKVPDTVLSPGDLVDRVSRWKSRAIRPSEAANTVSADADDSWTLAAAGYRRYQESLKTAGAVDFDDLLLLVDELFSNNEEARRTEAGRFDHLLVDEYQDTSGIQERILTALARDHASICVVGDDDQSIYSWRGAEISHILDFARRWPGAKVVKLEENYRSTPEIIQAANLLIERNARRHGKTLISNSPAGMPPAVMQAQDEADESRRVVGDLESLLRERRCSPGEAVILVRTGEQTRSLEQELRRRQIAYELVGSRSFFDRREVKDVMAFLWLLVEPDDDLALARIGNIPPRGISSQTVQSNRARAAETGTSLWQAFVSQRDSGKLSSAAASGVAKLERVISLRQASEAEPGQSRGAAVLRRLLDEVGYRGYLDKEYEDDPAEAESRWACCEEVAAALDEHERARPGETDLGKVIRGFLDDFVLQVEEQEDRSKKDDKPKGDVVRLMTLHAAKGLEFECVWMVGMEEGILPHHRSLGGGLQAIDEERRLCYVGVTRARKRLVLSLCLTRTKWGRSKPCRPSRFLYELTGQAEKFQEAGPEAKPSEPRGRGRRAKR